MLTTIFLAAACLVPPADGPIVEPFRQPACPYCPGHRGIEYAVADHSPVVAAAGGLVKFAGSVAGTLYVVVEHTDGLLATYGQLRTSAVGEGETVDAGQVIAASTTRLYFGLRRGDEYIDPATLLARRRGAPRLVPIGGGSGRPPRQRPARCSMPEQGRDAPDLR